MAAAKNKHSDVVDTLLKRGATVDIEREVGSLYQYLYIHCCLCVFVHPGWNYHTASGKLLQRQLRCHKDPNQAWHKY